MVLVYRSLPMDISYGEFFEGYFSDNLINVGTYYFQNTSSNVLSPSPPHLPLSSQLLLEFTASLAMALQCVAWVLVRELATQC